MLDVGLLVSGASVLAAISLAARWAPTSLFERGEVLDRLLGPAMVGLLAARLTAAVLDDRTSLRSVRAVLVIRGGVEFWAGVIAMLAVLGWGLRRRRLDVWLALAELAPFALWGYAVYEASCVVRDGCYGPASGFGMVPDGLQTRMFPVGLVVAATVTAAGLAVRHLWAWPPAAKVLLAIGAVAATRAVASFWLPHLGGGFTRPHLESIAVAAGAALVGVAVTLRGLRTPRALDAPLAAAVAEADARRSPSPERQ